MSLFLEFELVMLVLYGIESLAYAPGDAVLTVRTTLARVRLARPWQIMATRRGRVLVAGWAPWDVGMVAAPWPISIHGDRVTNRPSHALFDTRAVETLPAEVLSASQLDAVTCHDSELWVNGRKFALCASREQARLMVRLLRRWRDSSESDRQAVVKREMRRHLSVRRATRRWTMFRREARLAVCVSVALAVLIFVVLPLIYVNLGLERYWRFLIPMYGLLVVMGGMEMDRLYRCLYPQSTGERWKQVVLTIIAPTHAMRLANHVGHDLLSGFHPVVVAQVAGNPQQARDAARETWLSLHHARLSTEPDPAEVEAMVRAAREHDQRELDAWIAQQGHQSADWSKPPTRTSDSCVAFCPRCASQYTEVDAGCRLCGGLKLTPFADEGAAVADNAAV
ncbi:hypothetical protein [Algisphaera agarilytica]|uniref:Uncharacterized protein n=1 Tax=Algisphaera agarilytica TaxID=1385975 RepID=A0A7X0LMS5_9BACT|nr:hypothetical protein [Algisphaera agarilytica]MBB6431328.1 hypothetical protein [Algisphaera agarilytica]